MKQPIKQVASIALLAMSLAVVLAGLTACGTAEAQPLDVTYYYLPG